MGKRYKRHTYQKTNQMVSEMDARFRAFVEEHNAALAEAEVEPEAIQPDEDFAERFLVGMRRALGVAE